MKTERSRADDETAARDRVTHFRFLAVLTLRHTGLPKPYSASGFCTRMRLRVASSEAHSVSRSNSSASFGLLWLGKPGCGQSLPQTKRSGAALTKACAILVASG